MNDATASQGLAPERAPSITLLHAIDGRCRWRVPSLAHDPQLRQRLQDGLDADARVIGFELNPRCDSLTVQHRATAREVATVLRRVLRPPAANLSQVPPSRARPAPSSEARKERTSTALARQAGGPTSHRAFGWACGALAMSPLQGLATMAWIPLVACGVPIWRRALGTLYRERRLNVDFLDGLALAMALARRQVGTGALMAWMVHLGDFIRDRTALRSRRRIRELLDFEAVSARRLEADGAVQVVPADQLREGARALLLAGDIVPADGVLDGGLGAVDQRNITGESVPATRREGDVVYAGSSVVEGRFTMRVSQAGQDTTAARIVQMLGSAPVGETRMQNYAERFADRLVAPLLGANAALLALTGNVDRFMSMAIVDYGTGIRVAAPTSVLSSMTRAARQGILIKGGAHVERLAGLHGIAFDKTGTLTRGRLDILGLQSFSPALGERGLLRLAAAVEIPLRHPVARALVRHAASMGCKLPDAQDVEFRIGLGVAGRAGGHLVRVGSERYLRGCGIATAPAAAHLESVERHGRAVLLVAIDETLAGAIAYADELRPEAGAVVAALRRRSIRDIVMLTGDRENVARQIAGKLGIRHWFAEVLPADKARIIDLLKTRSGGAFGMVGDGVNDSPALARADVGIALVDGADIARDAADVVLMEDGLFRLVDAIDISRSAMALIRQNYSLITGANTLALGLAVPTGFVSPAVVTLLSNGSAIAAALNAMRPLMRPGRVARGAGPTTAG